MHFIENVFPPLLRFIDDGRRVAIVTLVNVEGASPRPVGSQIGVSDNGDHVGMITGGCAEKAIAAEALACIRKGENRLVRYGAGSPYVDVVLPCGSGIGLYFEAIDSEAIVRSVCRLHENRKPALLQIDPEALNSRIVETEALEASNSFEKACEPDFQIHIFGEGANLIALCSIASQAGYQVNAFSPDAAALQHLAGLEIDGAVIHREADFTNIAIDPYTAVITLFHEHEWELNILYAALNSNASYIGALGSRQTHKSRLEALAGMAPTQRPVSDIHGPVGLDIYATNPNEIAVSILAEITKRRRASS